MTRGAVRGELTVVRPATGDDVDRLAAWHGDPEVSRFWDDETFTADEVRERLSRERVDAWIVEAGGEPVGYLQSWWEPGQPLRGGLDGFLAPAARGRRLMPDAARALARHLLASGWDEVTVDPYAWNEAAIRAWGRAGFVEVSRHDADDDHPAPWVLMRFETPEPGSPPANQVRESPPADPGSPPANQVRESPPAEPGSPTANQVRESPPVEPCSPTANQVRE